MPSPERAEAGTSPFPHKEAAALGRGIGTGRCRPRSARATRSGARTAGVVGDNTDVEGLLAALDPLEPPAGPWLIVGTGGGARAAVVAAARRGAQVAVVSSRSAERAAAFEALGDRRSGTAIVRRRRVPRRHQRYAARTRADDPLPLGRTSRRSAAVALDLVYRTGETPWVRPMRAAGRRRRRRTRGMLVAQGAAALERWFPGAAAPAESCAPRSMPRFAEAAPRLESSSAGCCRPRASSARRRSRTRESRRTDLRALPSRVAAGARSALRALRTAGVRRPRVPDLRGLGARPGTGAERGLAGRVGAHARSTS